jgi:endoglucanase
MKFEHTESSSFRNQSERPEKDQSDDGLSGLNTPGAQNSVLREESEAFLNDLLNTPSPTGFESPIQKVVADRMRGMADSIESDVHGNLYIAVKPEAERSVMLAGHCDQIGFMVQSISRDGYISVDALGGIDAGVCPGATVTIHTANGPIDGIIGRKPIHLQSAEERRAMKVAVKDLWIDIGARDKAEAESLIRPGDPITFELGVRNLRNGLITGAGLDDRVGLFVAMEAARIVKERNQSDAALYAVSTVQEEVGLRGAETATHNVSPDVGIAIDVTHATDDPSSSNSKVQQCVLGEGPVIFRGPNCNPAVTEKLIELAEQNNIPYQIGISGRLLGNDARAMQVAQGGVATASIGIPNRYMHTQVEVCSQEDLKNAAELLALFTESVKADSDFRPFPV